MTSTTWNNTAISMAARNCSGLFIGRGGWCASGSDRHDNNTAATATVSGAATYRDKTGNTVASRTATATSTRANMTALAAIAPVESDAASPGCARLKRANESVTLVDDTRPPIKPVSA